MIEDAWVDLHLHTNFSDGLLTPTQVVVKAREAGLRAIGVVDHDTIDGIEEAVQAGGEYDVEIVPGVELSSQYNGRDLHILGYYFDPNHPRLMEYLEKFRQERYHRASKMIQNLNMLGVHLTMEEVAKRSRGRNIGRPHLAEVLMEKGIWVSAIRPPTVPDGTARLRVTLSTTHTEKQVKQLIAAISEVAVV